jgi:hypothetical protein
MIAGLHRHREAINAQLSTYDAILAARKRDYINRRLANDPGFALLTSIRNRINAAVRKAKRPERTLTLLGCTIAEARAHIEKQFASGMTWENYGEWEIDHIRPCASFNLRRKEERHACFHYSNLQPLWRRENRSKGSKWKPGSSPERPVAAQGSPVARLSGA